MNKDSILIWAEDVKTIPDKVNVHHIYTVDDIQNIEVPIPIQIPLKDVLHIVLDEHDDRRVDIHLASGVHMTLQYLTLDQAYSSKRAMQTIFQDYLKRGK